MLLVDLRNFIAQRGRVSMRDLAQHFQVDPDAVRGMLEHWIRKGKVSRDTAGPPCGAGCCHCASDLTEFYSWHGS